MFTIVHLKQPSVQVCATRRYIAQKRMIIVRKANNALKNPLTLIYTCGAKTYVQICRLSQPLITLNSYTGIQLSQLTHRYD